MFRDIQRVRQKLDREECLSVLKEAKRGVLSVIGDDGWPYGLPINHYYDEETGKLYFHSGKTGHKIDALRACEKASFCVMDEGKRMEGEWWLTFRSVVVFGRVSFVEDYGEAIDVSRKLSYRFTDDAAYIEREIVQSGPAVLVFSLTPEHMTGKLVREK